MSDHDIPEALARVDLFAGLPRKVLDEIAGEGTTRHYDAGVPVVEEGAKASGWASFSREGVCFFVILDGTADVEAHGVHRATLGAGQYFGETSLIDGQPRTATVTAGPSGLTAFALPAYSFAPILEENPAVAMAVLRVVVARLREAESRS